MLIQVLRQGEAIDQDFEYFKKSVKLAESKWHELKRETDRLDAGLDKQVQCSISKSLVNSAYRRL